MADGFRAVSSANGQRPTANLDSERHLDDRRARLLVQLPLLGEGHHQQVTVEHGALDPPPFRLQVDALAHGRLAAVHLAQLEQDGIEEVIDDALAAAQAGEAARGLADQDVGVVQRGVVVARAVLAARHQRGREVLGQLAGEVPRANPGAGHPLADHVRRVHHDSHLRKPSHTPRMRAMAGPCLRSSRSSAPMRPTPRCRRATQ